MSNLTSEIEKSVPKCDRDLNPGPQDVGSVQTDPLDLQRNVYTFNSLRYIQCLLLFPKSRKIADADDILNDHERSVFMFSISFVVD